MIFHAKKAYSGDVGNMKINSLDDIVRPEEEYNNG